MDDRNILLKRENMYHTLLSLYAIIICEVIFMSLAEFILEVLSAVGTVGATLLALWLAVHDKMRKVDAVFVWGTPTDYQPMLYIKNMGNKAIVIDCIRIEYRGNEVCKIQIFDSFDLRKFAILKSCEEITIPFGNKIPEIQAPKSMARKYWLEVTIVPRRGRSFVSKQKYSFLELDELLFNSALFSKD